MEGKLKSVKEELEKEDLPVTYKEKLERVKQAQEKLRDAAMQKEEMAGKAERAWEELIKKSRSVIDQMMIEMEEEKESLKQQAKEKILAEEKDQSAWFMMTFQEEQAWLESRRGSISHIEIVTLEKLKSRSEFLIGQLGIEMSNAQRDECRRDLRSADKVESSKGHWQMGRPIARSKR